MFSKDSGDSNTATPMDIDSAEKSKGKGKGKQVATATTDKNKFCHICHKTSHDTQDCYQLAKNADKKTFKPKVQMGTDSKQGGNTGNPAAKVFKAKKMRVIQVEFSDDEGDTPQPSATISTARIEEIEEPETSVKFVGDELQTVTPTTSDFLSRYMSLPANM